MTLNFTALTAKTCAGPLTKILVDVRPNISFGNKTLSCFNTQMREVVQGIKNRTAKSLRNKRKLLAGGSVARNTVA